jgi:hypothetical protein
MPRKFGWHHFDLVQWRRQLGSPDVPKQKGTEHDALEDARHNKEVWKVLNVLSKR